ncbi:hypothetical protein SERLA73DRAFT_190343, partial [Serpula lacrymans var. lacrymans S7.3]
MDSFACMSRRITTCQKFDCTTTFKRRLLHNGNFHPLARLKVPSPCQDPRLMTVWRRPSATMVA